MKRNLRYNLIGMSLAILIAVFLMLPHLLGWFSYSRGWCGAAGGVSAYFASRFARKITGDKDWYF